MDQGIDATDDFGSIRADMRETVESRLKRFGVAGITVTSTKGFGECADVLVAPGGTFASARIDTFIDEGHAQQVIDVIWTLPILGHRVTASSRFYLSISSIGFEIERN